MLTKEYILKELKNHIPEFKLKYGVEHIGLFGSYANNKQTEKSDIDVVVEFQPGAVSFDHYMDLTFFLEDYFETSVDLVIKEDIKPALRPYIIKEITYV